MPSRDFRDLPPQRFDKYLDMPSANLADDGAFELFIHAGIEILDACIHNHGRLIIDNPIAQRELLDFFHESRRRYVLHKLFVEGKVDENGKPINNDNK